MLCTLGVRKRIHTLLWKLQLRNRGTLHYVAVSITLYRASGENAEWQSVDPDPSSNDSWVNITNLKPGKYEVRVVATAGDGDTVRETRSKIWIVYVGEDSSK